RLVERVIKGKEVMVNTCTVTRVPTHTPDSNPLTTAKVHGVIDAANAVWSKYGYDFSFDENMDYVTLHSSGLNRTPLAGPDSEEYGRLGNTLALLLNPQQNKVVVFFRGEGGMGWSWGPETTQYVSMPLDRPELYLAHELGHYFGLVHTMNLDNCSVVNLTNTDNDLNGMTQAVTGDDIHDTPGDPTPTCLSTVNALAVSGTHLFAGTNGGVFLSTTNNDTNWVPVNSGLTSTQVRSLAVSGTNLFAGTNGGVFLSTNNGTSWTVVNSGLTSTQVRSLTVSGTNLFAGTDGGVFLSTDNGTTWTSVNSGLTNTQVRALVASGTNLFAGTTSGVFLSTNNGTNWSAVNAPNYGLSNVVINSLAVSSAGLFAGTYFGVYHSINNGTTWTPLIGGLTPHIPQVWSFASTSTHLYAGTAGGLVIDSINNGTSWNHSDPNHDALLAWWRVKDNVCLDTSFTINNVDFNPPSNTPPLRNTMSYFGCTPLEFSPNQIGAIEYNLMNGRSRIPIRRIIP
ncbi:MAG: hypothetical protein WBN92_13250, partial [Terriglobia bacterium]